MGNGQSAAARRQVGGAHRVTVHRAVVPAGHVDGAHHGLSQYPPEPGQGGDRLGVGDGPGLGQQLFEGLLHGEEGLRPRGLGTVVAKGHRGYVLVR